MGFKIGGKPEILVGKYRECWILTMRRGTVLVLFLVVLGYCFLGGAVFLALEHGYDVQHIPDALNVSQYAKVLEEMRSNTTKEDNLENIISEAIMMYQNGTLKLRTTEKPRSKWSFRSATFFSVTVITTIGYGTLTPSTISGRIFCIFYAMIGIPLAFVLLAAIGDRVNTFNRRFDRHSGVLVQSHRLIKLIRFFCTLGVGWLAFIMLPACMFSLVEGWSFHEAAYFAFITLSTIGFGDFSPEVHLKSYPLLSRLMIIIWLFLGLTWLSTTLNALQEALTRRVITHKGHETQEGQEGKAEHLPENESKQSLRPKTGDSNDNVFELRDCAQSS